MTQQLHDTLAEILVTYKESLTKLNGTAAFRYLEDNGLEHGICHYLTNNATFEARREFYAIFNDRYPDRQYLCIPPDRAVMFSRPVMDEAIRPRVKFLEAILAWPITETSDLHPQDSLVKLENLRPAPVDLFTFDSTR